MRHFQLNHLFTEKPVLKKTRGRAPRSTSEPPNKQKRKAKIPAAVQEAIWITRMGRIFEGKCLTTWCPNIITVFDFHAGHDIPESKGGSIDPGNLYPICARCNQSMGDRYTFQEWCAMAPAQTAQTAQTAPKKKKSWFACFS